MDVYLVVGFLVVAGGWVFWSQKNKKEKEKEYVPQTADPELLERLRIEREETIARGKENLPPELVATLTEDEIFILASSFKDITDRYVDYEAINKILEEAKNQS